MAARAHILHIATREFASKGYEERGTDEIADRASINKRMIYHYFSSKELLTSRSSGECLSQGRAAGKLLGGMSRPGAAGFVEFTFDSFVRDRTFINLLATENREGRESRNRLVTSLNSAIIEAMGRIHPGAAGGGRRSPGSTHCSFGSRWSGSAVLLLEHLPLSVVLETGFDRRKVLAARRAHVVDFVMNAVRPWKRAEAFGTLLLPDSRRSRCERSEAIGGGRAPSPPGSSSSRTLAMTVRPV